MRLPKPGGVDRRDPVRAVRQVEAGAEEVVAVARDLRQDLAEPERHDREVVAAQAQRRQADHDPEERRDDAAEEQQQPDRDVQTTRARKHPDRQEVEVGLRDEPLRAVRDADALRRALLAGELLRREPGGRVRAGGVERDVPEVEQPRVADDDVEADGHHHEHEHVDAGRDVGPGAEDRHREQVREVERVHDRRDHGGDREQSRAVRLRDRRDGERAGERSARATRACSRRARAARAGRRSPPLRRAEGAARAVGAASRRRRRAARPKPSEWSVKEMSSANAPRIAIEMMTRASSRQMPPARAQLVAEADLGAARLSSSALRRLFAEQPRRAGRRGSGSGSRTRSTASSRSPARAS